MKKALQVAMFSLFTVIGFNAQANEHHHETKSEAQPQVISATGVVKRYRSGKQKNHHPSRSDCCRELAGDDHALYHHPADENE